MKYSDTKPPIRCYMTNSTCYKGTRTMTIKGVLWHCTGANNPTLKRYVQPSNNDKNYSNLINLIGKNTAGTDWNHITRQAGVNAWIGKLANGTVATVQAMPWNYRPWGCGSGSKGSCNNGWIQFEICEDNLKNPTYFNQVYKEACELTAYLCKKYNINPKGTVKNNGVTTPTILCHQDSYRLGLGGNHADVYNWFNNFGKTMQDVRNDVAQILKGINQTPQKEEEEMTQEQFNSMMKEYRKTLQDNDCNVYSAEAREWAIKNGIVTGSGKDAKGEPNYMWADQLSREQAVTIFYRFAKLMGKA